MAELQGCILSFQSVEEKYESPYVVCPPGWLTYIHDSLLYQDAAAKFTVDKAIS